MIKRAEVLGRCQKSHESGNEEPSLSQHLCKRYGLEEGSEVLVEDTADGLSIRPAITLPVEIYSKERRAAFLLENAVDAEDYARAREEVRKMGVDPDAIPHERLKR